MARQLTLIRGSRGGDQGSGPLPTAPWNVGKNVVIGFVNGAGLILLSIYAECNPE